MARYKRSAGLIELVPSVKRKPEEKASGGGLRWPRWFIRAPRNAAATARGVESTPTSAPHTPPLPHNDDQDQAVEAVERTSAAEASPPISTSSAGTTALAATATSGATHKSAAAAASAPTRRGDTVDCEPWWLHDRDHRRFRVTLTYNSAVVVGMAAMVVLALVYLLGRHTVSPQMAVADNTLRSDAADMPIRSDVLEVGPGARTVVGNRTHAPATRPAGGEASPPPTGGGTGGPGGPVATVPVDPTQRVVGMNYVIVQSFLDEPSAVDARDALVRAGIAATIERGPVGWAGSNWFSVVGLKPFSSIRSADYEQYVASIRAVSDAQGGPRFKRFDPKPFKWK